MKRILLLQFFLCVVGLSLAQVVTTSPAFPVADQPVTITVDVSGTSLDKFAWNSDTNPVYIWTWIPGGSGSIDAPTNINPATSPGQDAAKCFRLTTNPDKYQITFTPTLFFNKPASEITQIGLKLKSKSWADNKQTDVDKFITFTSGFSVKFTAPTQTNFFVSTGDQIPITLKASATADLEIKVGGVSKATLAQNTTLTYTHTVAETQGSVSVSGSANNGTETKTSTFTYYVRSASTNAPRPAGIVDGINYNSSDASKATLSLLAPGKTSVYVIGDFNNWTIDEAYKMKKDGEHFWLDVSGLVSGTEYGFQYLVDESIKMADPFADKVLDPDDQYIPATTYPNLKTYPAQALNTQWYFNRVAILQTGQTPYAWQTSAYQKPASEKLVIYELHIRDFFGDGAKNYQNLIDTLGYFKKMGINAIELMPITEFNGNDSWGYNPTFMFAVDKFYGTKNKLKEFVDKCHANGIAVIMDMVLNHQDLPNAYVMMDFDFTGMKPNPTNKWFNVTATHPFSVFFDMNHESVYTQHYVDTVNYHWLNEYKIDGFRYDLSKGFTQKNSGDDVNGWSSFDQSRINILKRMAAQIRTHTPDAYIILEHFADNTEETILAADGMMLWGNANNAYTQAAMGFGSNSDISWGYYKTRSWTDPRLVTYMESHDEERMMYKTQEFGNASGTYSTASLNTALNRMKAAATFFYTVPGPKMIWQFGELGYDESINRCTDGTISSNCRVTAKPVHWEYRNVPARSTLQQYVADLIRLRNTYAVFTKGDATVTTGNALVKQITLNNVPFTTTPADASQMNVQVVGNFDVTAQTASVTFSHTGTWYDYITAVPLQVTTTSMNISLQPGEYKLYTDVVLRTVTAVEEENVKAFFTVFPNPSQGVLQIDGPDKRDIDVKAFNVMGQSVLLPKMDRNHWDATSFVPGLYILKISQGQRQQSVSIIRN
ncbi:alpha-amylase family glycosyl hydrolase [Chryseolinea lacunae]|uniref:T9SS type A sorting domain-containing protein n=1 Tax=Chryseolinea lacunae TaxID=2801331 RepID=A0ABS1L210_9BACT|nr:alpha-amylase family glycosyl hydrolase [Chryseolinea lacunae]MBL0745610.1 T9SS type A sorting domain-containing protein [Chryseolinea lacunae]